MALALYRRYRPDTFDGIIGQDQVTVPLSRALDAGRLTHAYLFSGPRGCGKTSSARILARCINCEQGPTSHPCGECPNCKDLGTGGPGSIDVVEIDAASHNGVDDARELRERAAFAPARDRYKIFILDEAHMVTQQGFNALLKIVEEPPEHVMFIFATTEPDKVISTIRSRTHHYPFRLVPQEVMGPYLEKVCKQEKIEPEPGVLGLAMKAGGGSVRDTLSVLDQLMVGAVDGKISYDSAVSLLGFTPDALIGEAVDDLIEGDGEGLYGVVEKVVVGGFEPRRFVEDLLARIRDLLVLTLGGEQAAESLGEETASLDMSQLQRQAKALGLSALTMIAEIIDSALAGMVGATSARMRLELLAARLLAARRSGFAPTAVAGAVGTGSEGMTPSSTGAQSAASKGGSVQRGGFIGRRGAQTEKDAGMGPAATGGPAQQGHAGSSVSSRKVTSPDVGGVGTDAGSAVNEPEKSVSSGITPQKEATSGVDSTAKAEPAHPDAAATQTADTIKVSAAEKAVRRTVGEVDPAAPVQEKWEVVLRALPVGVSEYVNQEKVPVVSLATNPAGRARLSMTFDTALSQHAFALAIASDPENEGKKASWVVLETVKVVFGPSTTIAPTPVAANGEHVTSTKRMKPEELAQVKRKIAMAKAGLTMASDIVSPSGRASESKERRKVRDEDGGDSDDASHAVQDQDVDPWFQTPAQAQHDAKETEVARLGVGQVPEREKGPVEDHDAGVQALEAHGDPASDANVHHKKHVAVPDISDGVDPWAVAEDTDDQVGGIAPTIAAAGSIRTERSPHVFPQSDVNRQADVQRTDTDVHNSDVHNLDVHDSNVYNPVKPEVPPEDDVYSLSDRSLGGDDAVSIDDLTRMFEVKKVEEFDAEDPKNPKNAKPAAKSQESQKRAW